MNLSNIFDDDMQEDMDGLAGLGDPNMIDVWSGGQWVQVPSQSGIQVDPSYYRYNNGWTYNQCNPFQVSILNGRQVRRCAAGYEPAGQSVCASRWVRLADGSYIEYPGGVVNDINYQNCLQTRAGDCSGCRIPGGIGTSAYNQNASMAYHVCDYQGGAMAPDEAQREYLVTQAIRNGFLAQMTFSSASICDGNNKQASYLRGGTYRLQNGQTVSFDTAAAYAAQYFNVPTQLMSAIA